MYNRQGNIGRVSESKTADQQATVPKVHMDAFSSSVKSIEGCIHELILFDAATGYRWMYAIIIIWYEN